MPQAAIVRARLTGHGRFLMKCTNESVTVELKTGKYQQLLTSLPKPPTLSPTNMDTAKAPSSKAPSPPSPRK